MALVDWRLPVQGADAVDFAATHGLGGLQLDMGGPGRAPCLDLPATLLALRHRTAHTAVQLIALACNHANDLGLASAPHTREGHALRQLMTRTLATAQVLGIPTVFFPSFRNGLIRSRAALMMTAENLRWACRQARPYGIAIATENDLGLEDNRALIQAVGYRNFSIVIDALNPLRHGVAVTTLAALPRPRICSQLHLKDGNAASGNSLPLGQGDAPLAALLEHFAPVAQWYVLENDYRDGDSARIAADRAWLEQHLHAAKVCG